MDNNQPTDAPGGLRDAACSPSVSDTPETDEQIGNWQAAGYDTPLLEDFCRKLERERDAWKSRFADAVERLEGKLHCADDCKCSGRLEVKRLRQILLENDQV